MIVAKIRVILLGGTSHVGKSSLARTLADQLDWAVASTDGLARHPGRPWAEAPLQVKPHVAAHYRDLSLDELIASVLEHYRGVWPLAETLIDDHLAAERGLVLEGSALWPPYVASIRRPAVSAIWLTADESLLETRILNESRYNSRNADEQVLVRKFLARTLQFDVLMRAEVARLGLPLVKVDQSDDMGVVAGRAMAGLGMT